MSEIKKLDLRSMDIVREQKEKLRQLFPEVFTESRVDFEKLKLTLGKAIEVGKERYGMTWPGKADCFKIIQNSSIGTLKPCREESVNFDTTNNLFIEGDNLEVLKLLQKSYYGKVKMIYIDPPYNTGNDFIYPDDYKENLTTYLQYTGQVDAQGKRFSTNTDTEGRFHSKWLNMMFPRLFLAKNLLKMDGVIFVSIDDNESSNLRFLMNEIFGEENFIADIVVVNNLKGRNDKRYIATAHERLLMYTKSYEFEECGLELPEGRIEEFNKKDQYGKYRELGLRKRGGADTREKRRKMFFPLYINKKNGAVSLVKNDDFTEEVWPRKSDGSDGCWRWGKETVQHRLDLLVGQTVGSIGKFDVFVKDYLETDGEVRRIKPKSVMLGANYSTDGATKAFRKLLGEADFKNPKPVFFLRDLVAYSSSPNETHIILDFFAGSGSLAQAVIEQNINDGGNRQFICVQLPEKLSEDEVTYKNKFRTIADIAKERIRRVIKNIEKETDQALFKNKKMDLGFKVFKLDKSNFKIWDAEQISSDKVSIEKQLELHIDHINYKASQGDILYEILLKAGFELTTKIEKIKLAGKTVYSIEGGAMLICLEKELTKEDIKAMAEKHPSRVICLDRGFANNDQLKTNAVQIMKSKGVDDFRTV